ncbi:MAG TPA: DMT family transporter [Terriglobales bacterium]|nr:DMT family transporter [Terriglobales bacterium]
MSARGGTSARARVWLADLALLGVTLVWGVTFPVVKAALADAGPLSFNAARLSLAALLLAAVYWPRRRLPAATWGVGALLGLFLAAGYALQTVGLETTPPAVSAFLTSVSVVLVPALLAVGWRRRLAPTAWAGALLALAGLYLLLAAPGGGVGTGWGEGLTLGCALAFALHIITLGEWAPRLGFRDLAVLQIGFAAAFTWVALPLAERPHWQASPRLGLALLATAVLATAVAFTAQSWAQQFTPATHTAVVFAFEPVFAWLASTLGWHERLRAAQLAGAALIVLAMVVVEWRTAERGGAAEGIR